MRMSPDLETSARRIGWRGAFRVRRMEAQELAGKVAIVTGGAGGIGRATAAAARRRGRAAS